MASGLRSGSLLRLAELYPFCKGAATGSAGSVSYRIAHCLGHGYDALLVGGGVARILPNLIVYTGAAEYGKPAVQRVFGLD